MTAKSVKAELQAALLPVSGRRVVLRAPTGTEDLLLLEAPDDDLALALVLMERLARPVGDESRQEPACADWSSLTATDLDVFILRLRQSALGDRVVSDVRCHAEGCGQRIDISFGIDQYLRHYVPARTAFRGRGWIVEPGQEPRQQPGWFQLILASANRKGGTAAADAVSSSVANERPSGSDLGVHFRLPTIADLLAVAGRADAVEELARRCIRPGAVSVRQRRAIEAAMEAIAPHMSQDLQGICPDCGAQVKVFFNSRRYCLRELRDRAAFVYQDIDVLARRYHWAESDILALPRIRRMHYAEAARQEGAA